LLAPVPENATSRNRRGGRHRAQRESAEKKIQRAGGVFVHRPREPSPCGYCPRERLRPTHAPCSLQESIYRVGRRIQGPRETEMRNLRKVLRDPGRAAFRAGRSTDPDQNSASRWRFRPPSPRTFALRLLPSGAASTYSRSVLAARENLRCPGRAHKHRQARNTRNLRGLVRPHIHSCRVELWRTSRDARAAARAGPSGGSRRARAPARAGDRPGRRARLPRARRARRRERRPGNARR
jgi:hypothetical protein